LRPLTSNFGLHVQVKLTAMLVEANDGLKLFVAIHPFTHEGLFLIVGLASMRAQGTQIFKLFVTRRAFVIQLITGMLSGVSSHQSSKMSFVRANIASVRN